MITVPLIGWQPIEAMPLDRKDGRQMLLWDGNPAIGSWGEHYSGGEGWNDTGEHLPIDGVTYWADINPPI